MESIVVATRNKGKLKEIREILGALSVNLLSLDDFSRLPEVIEDQLTFQDNALKKAKVIAEITGLPVLAEDSGLEIRALGGRPGIYSARFAGENANDAKNTKKVLDLMRDVPEEKRQARFITSACFFIPASFKFFTEGICEGNIIFKPLGENGFGYDPIFVPKGYKKTFAELSKTVKNRISHRAKALREMRKKIMLGLVKPNLRSYRGSCHAERSGLSFRAGERNLL
ncbi:MAG: XTP/dITP diphosphatase [bacterium]